MAQVNKNEVHESNALTSFKAIMKEMNKHRQIEPDDFVDEYFIPDHI